MIAICYIEVPQRLGENKNDRTWKFFFIVMFVNLLKSCKWGHRLREQMYSILTDLCYVLHIICISMLGSTWHKSVVGGGHCSACPNPVIMR